MNARTISVLLTGGFIAACVGTNVFDSIPMSAFGFMLMFTVIWAIVKQNEVR